MIKLHLLILFLFSSCVLFGQQANLTLDWLEKGPEAHGRLIDHDNVKNTITCGEVYNGSTYDLLLIKYDTSGNRLWTKIYQDPYGGRTQPWDLKLDSANNIYITGIGHLGLSTGNTEGFILKYDAQGNLIWDRFNGWQDTLTGKFHSIAIYDNQYIYAAGYLSPFDASVAGTKRTNLVKYDLAGNLIWSFGDSISTWGVYEGVQLDKSGNIYFIGTSNGILPNSGSYVVKIDSLGNKLWGTVVIDSLINGGISRYSAIDDSANIYVGSDTNLGPSTLQDAGLAKIDSSGVLKWVTGFDNSQNIHTDEFVNNIFFDKGNNAYIYGLSYDNSGQHGRSYLAKFDIHGHLRWGKIINDSTMVNGFFIDGYNFINDSTFIIAGLGFIVASVDTSGSINWLSSLLSLNFYIVDVDFFDSSIAATGYYWPINWLPDSIITFQVSLNYATGVVSIKGNPQKSNVFPNPFKNQLVIQNSENAIEKTQVKIYTLIGKSIYEEIYLGYSYQINTSEWPSGVYILETQNKSGTHRQKIIKQY